MKTKNHRKETNIEAKTERSGRNPVHSKKRVKVIKAKREQSILPGSTQKVTYEPSLARTVGSYNIQQAIKAVKRNKGAAGIDGLQTSDLDDYLLENWERIKQEILEGKYKPKAVRRVEIPKPDGKGIRQLGIPTVMDRVIQQAIHQELSILYEPLFSNHSYGFRKNRSAHQAVLQSQEYIKEGCNWVVDIDLERFFDKVNHDTLMSKIARRVKDKKLLLLIRRYLQAGALDKGLITATKEGTPQGGPLSPLLSNIMLDDFDKELEKRGLRFVRYADDCNIYVKSEKAGKRVKESVERFLTEKLKLKVNKEKSRVANSWDSKFLGFSFGKGKYHGQILIHKSRIQRLKDKIRGLTRKLRGNNIEKGIRKYVTPLIRGWANYFKISENFSTFRNLDGWIRRKIRGVLWRQWKKPKRRLKQLVAGGVKKKAAKPYAYSSKGPWRMAKTPAIHKALSNEVIESLGYKPLEKLVKPPD
jgi:group II intron reverse transcriptase/maturase